MIWSGLTQNAKDKLQSETRMPFNFSCRRSRISSWQLAFISSILCMSSVIMIMLGAGASYEQKKGLLTEMSQVYCLKDNGGRLATQIARQNSWDNWLLQKCYRRSIYRVLSSRISVTSCNVTLFYFLFVLSGSRWPYLSTTLDHHVFPGSHITAFATHTDQSSIHYAPLLLRAITFTSHPRSTRCMYIQKPSKSNRTWDRNCNW